MSFRDELDDVIEEELELLVELEDELELLIKLEEELRDVVEFSLPTILDSILHHVVPQRVLLIYQ